MNDPYPKVRRIEEAIYSTIQNILQTMVFEPNTAATWQAVTNSVNQAMNDLWQQGALQGNTAAQAFQVQCDLGTSMTEQDLTTGLLKVTTKAAIIHPAQFVVIENEIMMATSS